MTVKDLLSKCKYGIPVEIVSEKVATTFDSYNKGTAVAMFGEREVSWWYVTTNWRTTKKGNAKVDKYYPIRMVIELVKHDTGTDLRNKSGCVLIPSFLL